MQISNKFPPNYAQLKSFITDEHPIFTYGDTVYAPYHEKIPDDVLEHEKVHIEQQKLYTSPDIWWNKYILDRDFRLSQELEAFAKQYQWIRNISKQAGKASLIELAGNLSSPLYRLNLTYGQAEKMIKKYGKKTI